MVLFYLKLELYLNVEKSFFFFSVIDIHMCCEFTEKYFNVFSPKRIRDLRRLGHLL